MDDDLVGQLLDTAAGRLGAYGLLLTGSERMGDELFQAAIVKALVRHRGLRDVEAAEAEVRLAMRTLHLDAIRRAASWRAALPSLGSRSPEADVPFAAAPDGPVDCALAALSPHQRAAVVLRHCDHLLTPEIAAAMRTSENAVEGYLADARTTLALTLGELEPDFDQVLVVDRSRR